MPGRMHRLVHSGTSCFAILPAVAADRYLGVLRRKGSRVTDELFAVQGKVALITGGSSGIGLMIARGLLRRGVKTYIVGRRLAHTREVAAQLCSEGTCIGFTADLADPQGPQQLAAELARHEP